MQYFTNQLEKKVHDLQLCHNISLQKVPMLRMLQKKTSVESLKKSRIPFQSTPSLERPVCHAIDPRPLKICGRHAKKVADTTNDLLKKNVEMLRTNSVSIARETERGIVDLSTLKQPRPSTSIPSNRYRTNMKREGPAEKTTSGSLWKWSGN
ncbi:MAG: toxic anion resistance protein [Turicibacter sp.]|nr:toxic anion resistance protein [Turicibacter sp.]